MLGEVVASVTNTHLLAIGVCLLFIYYLIQPRQNLPKGPWGWPILGNINLLAGYDSARVLAGLRQTYGGILHMKLGSKFTLLMLQEHKVVREAYVEKTDSTSSRPLEVGALQRLTKGKPIGIFLNIGESHKQMRRFALLGLRDFGVGKVSIEEKIAEEADAIINVITKVDRYESEDFRLTCQRGVSNVIVNIVFGQRLEYGDTEFIEVQKNLNELFGIPILGQPKNFIPWLKYVPFVPDKIDDLIEIQMKIYDFLRKKMDEHRDTFDPNNIRDFTDLFLKNEGAEEDSYLNRDSLFRTIVDLFQAGTETTATALTWVIRFMASHLEVQEKVHQLIDKVIGPGRRPAYADRHEMPYVEAVFNETFRLGTIAPFTPPHLVTEDITLGKYDVPKGTLLMANIYALHMDKDYWGDPEVFRPERWLDDKGNLIKHESFMPFSSGKRSCIGEHLAKMEIFIFLTHFLQQLEFRLPEGQSGLSLGAVQGIVRRPKSFDVIIKRRKTASK